LYADFEEVFGETDTKGSATASGACAGSMIAARDRRLIAARDQGVSQGPRAHASTLAVGTLQPSKK
jgi:hypothetical protein